MYTCPCDLVDMTRMREKTGPKIIVPRARSCHFEYTEINGKPQEEITALLQRLVTEFASQGGRFLMCGNELSRRETMERDREEARGRLGALVDQPDIWVLLFSFQKRAAMRANSWPKLRNNSAQ